MSKRFIAISGLPKSGKSCISTILRNELGLGKYSIGDYFKGLWKQEYPQQDIPFSEYWKNIPIEQQRSANELATQEILTGKYVADLRYHRELEEQGGLLVFIYASTKTRAQRASEAEAYPGQSLSFVIKDLRRRKKDEIEWGRKLYGDNYDFTKAKNYDLYINSESLKPEKIANIILEAYR